MLGTTAGKYKIIDRIGRGSMGTVYRASDETLRRDVAIKVLNADFNDPAAGRRFRAEAIAIARLNHQGIAKIYDLFEHEGQWLMAMELVAGETLESLIAREGPLSAERAADLGSQALAALSHAHGLGVVHRDLKPANLMVALDGRLKVMDFGIARVEGTEHLTSAGLLMGTPAYMAPEQVLGEYVDARTDIFAIGCVMFFLATAKLPFKGDTAMDMVQSRLRDAAIPAGVVRPDLPAWFGAVVDRSLARDPANRFQTAEEFRDAIARGRAGLPQKTLPVPVPSGLLETIRPGSMPVRVQPASPSGAHAVPTAPGSTAPVPAVPMPAVDMAATQLRPRAASRAGLWLGLAAVVVIASAAVWFWPRQQEPTAPPPASNITSAPTPATTQTPLPPPPVQSPAASATPTATPVASPAPSAAATPTPSPIATPSPVPTSTVPPVVAGRRGAADPQIAFETVKIVAVTGRRGEVFDGTLKLGGGTVVALPKRADDAPTVALAYKELLAATFVRSREPRWSQGFAGPPPDLTLPTSVLDLGRRPVRNWLVLQGKSRFMILALADADAERILKEVTDRSRMPINRPADGK